MSQNREIVGSEAFLAVIWSQKVKILFFLLLRFKIDIQVNSKSKSEDGKKYQCGKILHKLRCN